MGSLQVLEGSMNVYIRYIKVLEQHMLSSRQRIFQGLLQQDNTTHTVTITSYCIACSRLQNDMSSFCALNCTVLSVNICYVDCGLS